MRIKDLQPGDHVEVTYCRKDEWAAIVLIHLPFRRCRIYDGKGTTFEEALDMAIDTCTKERL